MAQKKKENFKLFVGIDFGTDGSGISYCEKETGAAYIHNLWDDANASQKTKTSVLFDQTGSIIRAGSGAKSMYLGCTEDKGWKLFEKFKMNLYQEPTEKSQIRESEQKMDFVELKEEIETTNDKNVKESSATVFIAQLKYLKSQAFTFIEAHFKNKLKLRGDAESGWPEVQYFLTVPAIWSDKAKDVMVKWSIEAGLIDKKIKDQLKIVYEPDCASLSIQYAIIRGMNDKKVKRQKKKKRKKGLQSLNPQIDDINVPLQTGDKYLLCDAGGGTVDIACHEVMGRFSIAEVLHPSGGKWGATYIDEAFIKLLGELFSKDLLNIFQMCAKKGTSSYLKLLNYFLDESKTTFYDTHPNEIPPYHDIQMPSTFVTFVVHQFVKEFKEGNESLAIAPALKDLNDRLAKVSKRFKKAEKVAPGAVINSGSSQLNDTNEGDNEGANDANDANEEKVKYAKMKKRDWMIKIIDAEDDDDDDEESEDSDARSYEETYLLSLHHNVWEYLFDTIIDPIVEHCKKILSKQTMKDAKYIFLVGGFAQSKYFQMRMKKEFDAYKNVKVVVPGLPGLCVVDGAARWGLDQSFVKIRRLPKTYGIDVDRPKKSCILKSEFYPKGHIGDNIYYNEKFKEDYVHNCFNIFVRRGDAVKLEDKPIVQELRKTYTDQTAVGITIYSSTKTNPMTTTKEEATKLGYVSIPLPKDKEGITCEFSFSSSLLTVCAYPKGQRSQKKLCQVEYL